MARLCQSAQWTFGHSNVYALVQVELAFVWTLLWPSCHSQDRMACRVSACCCCQPGCSLFAAAAYPHACTCVRPPHALTQERPNQHNTRHSMFVVNASHACSSLSAGFPMSAWASQQVCFTCSIGSVTQQMLQVLLDGTDIRGVPLSWLRSQVGLVSQEPVLFATTIGLNISFGRPGSSQQQIEEAAKAANAHNFITSLPRG